MKLVRRLEQVRKEDVQRCGGKGANLGELVGIGMRVPPGFCILADALPYVLEANGLVGPIAEIAAALPYDDARALEAETGRIRSLIASAALPQELEAVILERYHALIDDGNPYVAVRSSVAVKDSPVSSFPGLMDTYHYVVGDDEVLGRIRQCWASLWTARAAFVRHQQGIAHDRGLIAPIVQAMIDAEVAGVMFTANPVSGARGEIVIESNWGIGESVVSGAAVTDHYVLDRATLETKTSKIAKKNLMVTIDREHGGGRAEQDVLPELAERPTLSETELAELGRVGTDIAQHFEFEADIEWAYRDGVLYILQTRRIRDLKAVPSSV
jgi:pyruvate, water dikinase